MVKQAETIDSLDLLARTFREALAPPEKLTVSEWADRFRWLTTKSSGEPGQWRTSRVPYVREIQDLLSWESDVETVIWMKGSQVAGTEALLNWAGYTMDCDPCPMMIVEPSLDPLSKRLSKQRIDPMIDACERLRLKVAGTKGADAGNTTYTKEFPGGILLLAGANSAAGLRQAPVRKLGLDEVDAYPPDVEGEGDPFELARARTRRFARRKIFAVSSPTIEGNSRIATLFEETDQAYYFVPCPDCNHMQRLVWSGIKYDRDLADKPIPESARYMCEQCGTLIAEHKKTWMFERGEWRSTYPERRGKKRGFHLSALYSPVGTWSWADCVETWKDAQGKPDLLKTFVNTILGETWKGVGDSPQWQILYNRREHYRIGSIPKGVLVLTAGIDVQKDRIEVGVMGWGERLEHWAIEHTIIHGNIVEEETKRRLARILDHAFPVTGQKGLTMHIRLSAIDAGYETQEVYKFVRARVAGSIIAVKGVEEYGVLVGHPSRADVRPTGQLSKTGMHSWPVGTSIAKRQLYGWLKQPQPTKPEETGFPDGWAHHPQFAEEYFKQLCAESAVPRKNDRGQVRWVWEAKHRNEVLDCTVYNRAAAAVIQLDRYTPADWKKLADQITSGPLPRARRATVVDAADEDDDYWGTHR